MSNPEELRTQAEKERVAAELERQHAESNEGSGRVEQEQGRVDAEKARVAAHEAYEAELKKLQDDPEHYMTPGAKRAFQKYRRDNILAYIVLAAAMAAGVWAFTNNSKENLKNDINVVVKASCLASRQPDSPINKFNDLVELQIEASRDARELNLERGELARARLNTENIIKLQESRIPVPSEKECEAPLLK